MDVEAVVEQVAERVEASELVAQGRMVAECDDAPGQIAEIQAVPARDDAPEHVVDCPIASGLCR